MNDNYKEAAKDFLENEKEFHLGFLPTEQSNVKTKSLEKDFQESSIKGVRTLQRPDRDVLEMAQKVIKSSVYKDMVKSGLEVVKNGGRIVFSGCGATGRLSILLESMWREYFIGNDYANALASIMTGGDYALVKSVESFEDYQNFGRRQVADLNMNSKDMLVAITEGGETSSVIGSIKEAVERDCKVFMLFNNPAEALSKNLIRCREVIDNPKVNVVDLFCGSMALAGSTRMQATTSEQLIAGTLLEEIIIELENLPKQDFIANFEKVLDYLESDKVVEKMAEYIEFEANVYSKNGKITYLANDYLLDIFTDTTERSPTFMLPPFKSEKDSTQLLPWAFVKRPICDTESTWKHLFNRPLRCLNWQTKDYEDMESPQHIIDNQPKITAQDLYNFAIGNEEQPDRFDDPNSGAVVVKISNAKGNAILDEMSKNYKVINTLEIDCFPQDSALYIMNHMLIKLVLNTISTGTMVVLGRVTGNWMSWVNISNKKLIDRAIRLVSELSNLSYVDSCYLLFEAKDELEKMDFTGQEPPSAVQYALEKHAKSQK